MTFSSRRLTANLNINVDSWWVRYYYYIFFLVGPQVKPKKYFKKMFANVKFFPIKTKM